MEPELTAPPDGPAADDATALLSRAPLERAVDFLAEFLLSCSRVPEGTLLTKHSQRLADLQREVCFCHWGIVVTLCVYQQLISHVHIAVREAVAFTLGAALAEAKGVLGETELYGLIEAELARHGIASLKPDMRLIDEELRCTALHSTVVCYVRDITMHLHNTRVLGIDCTVEAIFPMDRQCIGRNFFQRLLGVASVLLEGIVYGAMPLTGPVSCDPVKAV
jgi:hypothetical protein